MSTKVSYVYGGEVELDFHVYWDYGIDCYMMDFDGKTIIVSDEWVIRLWKAVKDKRVVISDFEPTINHRATITDDGV